MNDIWYYYIETYAREFFEIFSQKFLTFVSLVFLQSEKEKKPKKKKAKEGESGDSAADTAAETPASGATPSDSQRGSTRGSSSRRAKKAPSSVFVLFSQKQIAEFKEVTFNFQMTKM